MKEEEFIELINASWGWSGVKIEELIDKNEFCNLIVKDELGHYYRIMPEELSITKIAGTDFEYEELRKGEEFELDWLMSNMVEIGKEKYGSLKAAQSYCLKLPAVIGGNYEIHNIGLITTEELISFSGDQAYQIKDLGDGEEIEIVIK